MIVDLHSHHTPVEYLKLCKELGLGGSSENKFMGYPDPMSWAERLEMMQTAGVGKQVLSPTTAPYTHDEDSAVKACTQINNTYAAIAKEQSDQFDFWVSLPLPHVSAALAEIKRGLDELNGVGIVMGCFCLEKSVADPMFEPIYEELNKRNSVIFLHPCQNGICSHHINDWGLTVCAGASLEDSTVGMQLIASQIPIRFPNIKFVIPHFGGILPTLLNRLDGQMPQEGFAEKPSETAKKFFYDTVGWGSKAALAAAMEAFGATQIVTGSDFPILLRYESYKETIDHIKEGDIAQSDIEQILENSYQLLYGNK